MAFNINQFRGELSGGGANPTLFQVQIQNPVNPSGNLKVPFMVKTSSLPASSQGVIEVPYFGRKIKLKGDRVYPEWTTTVINDEDFLVRNALEEWMSAMNTPEGNITTLGSANPNLYKSQATVTQFGRKGNILRVYTFDGLFPTEIEPIELGWENNDTIEEFAVTWQYDWWRVSGGVTGLAGTNA